jgi:ribosome maturation factor RimP
VSKREITQLQEQIEARLADAEPGVELIALEQAGPDRLRLFIDSPDGVDLALCGRVSKSLDDLLDEWSLEVSSPGLERPLTKPAHFQRFLGHRVRVRTVEEIGGRKSFTGVLADAGEDEVSVEVDDDRVTIPLASVHRSNLIEEEVTT